MISIHKEIQKIEKGEFSKDDNPLRSAIQTILPSEDCFINALPS